jgi:hypothetical protein
VRLLAPLIAAGLGLVPGAARADAAMLAPLEQQRRVEVEITETTAILLPPPDDPLVLGQETFADEDETLDAGSWDATAQAPERPDSFATQISEIGPTEITVNADVRAQAPPLVPTEPAPATISSVAHARSRLSARFEVDEARQFRLRGSVVTSGFAFAGNPEARITLRGPDDTVLADLEWLLNPECDPFLPEPFCDLDPQSIDLSGVLETGVFTLEAFAAGDATTFRFADQSFGDVGAAAFDLELVLLPEPSTLALMALGFGGFALYARREARRSARG